MEMNNITNTILWLILSAFITFGIFVLSVLMQLFDDVMMNILGKELWHFVYFILPIIAFVAPVIIKFRSKLPLRKAALLSVVSIITYAFISVGIIFSVRLYFKGFNTEKWQTYPEVRHYMVSDMTNQTDFSDMTREDVTALLGTPDMPFADTNGEDLIEYQIDMNFIDPVMLTFVFEDNIVVEVYEYCESRISKQILYTK